MIRVVIEYNDGQQEIRVEENVPLAQGSSKLSRACAVREAAEAAANKVKGALLA